MKLLRAKHLNYYTAVSVFAGELVVILSQEHPHVKIFRLKTGTVETKGPWKAQMFIDEWIDFMFEDCE